MHVNVDRGQRTRGTVNNAGVARSEEVGAESRKGKARKEALSAT